jgi:hypothetical protein
MPPSMEHLQFFSPHRHCNGIYSSSSAYAALFLGRVDILGARQIWKTQMPGKCKFFAWLVLHGRCWTSDRLHRHGLKDFLCTMCASVQNSGSPACRLCLQSRDVVPNSRTYSPTPAHPRSSHVSRCLVVLRQEIGR